jgi:hypothetical protein
MVAVGEKQPLLRLGYDHGEESIDGVSVALDLKGIEGCPTGARSG